MVPYFNRKWYHFSYQYGTIFSFNMVPFSPAIWYHILLGFSPYWKTVRLRPVFKISLFLFQKGFSYFACGFRNHKIHQIHQKRLSAWRVTPSEWRVKIHHSSFIIHHSNGLRPRKANASAKHMKALHVDVATPRFRVSFAALPCSSEWRVKIHNSSFIN